jgi:hypothetical protein
MFPLFALVQVTMALPVLFTPFLSNFYHHCGLFQKVKVSESRRQKSNSIVPSSNKQRNPIHSWVIKEGSGIAKSRHVCRGDPEE